jgi:hypothetical protein
MSRLVIEDLPGGMGFRLYGGALDSPVTGKSVEDVIGKAASKIGVVVDGPEALHVSSTFEMAQVLESLMGPPRTGQIVTGLA